MAQKLHEVFATVLEQPISAISPATSPDMVRSWTSLRHMALVKAIEDTYAVKFSLDDILDMKSVGDAHALLLQKGVTP